MDRNTHGSKELQDSQPQPLNSPEAEAKKLPPLRPVGLMYTPLTKKAMAICFEAHKHQQDKSGMPYVIHPLHLAEQMETEHEVCTALLHDVVEDTQYTIETLRNLGIPQQVLEALTLLTHDPHTPYLDYVTRLRKNPIARRVKLADLKHNSDLDRLDAVGEADKRRLLKYRMAQAILVDDLYDAPLKQFRKRIPLSLTHPVCLSVFYDRDGRVLKYSIDVRKENVVRYELEAQCGEQLRIALNPNRTLPEALAEMIHGLNLSMEDVLIKAGIPYQTFRER